MERPPGYHYSDLLEETANRFLSNDPENTENLREGMILEFTCPQNDLMVKTSPATPITAGETLKLIWAPEKKQGYFRRTRDNKLIIDPTGEHKLFTAGEICTLIRAGTIKINQ